MGLFYLYLYLIRNIDWKTGVARTTLKARHGGEDNIKMNLNKTM
jgi:hypothetical protein